MLDCKTCKYWVEDREALNTGECRQKSPLPIVSKDGSMSCVWPVTNFNDFCASQEVDIVKFHAQALTVEEITDLISQAIEKNVISLDLEMGENNAHVFGRIMIDADPSEGDLELVTSILGETYHYVDVSLLKE